MTSIFYHTCSGNAYCRRILCAGNTLRYSHFRTSRSPLEARSSVARSNDRTQFRLELMVFPPEDCSILRYTHLRIASCPRDLRIVPKHRRARTVFPRHLSELPGGHARPLAAAALAASLRLSRLREASLRWRRLPKSTGATGH